MEAGQLSALEFETAANSLSRKKAEIHNQGGLGTSNAGDPQIKNGTPDSDNKMGTTGESFDDSEDATGSSGTPMKMKSFGGKLMDNSISRKKLFPSVSKDDSFSNSFDDANSDSIQNLSEHSSDGLKHKTPNRNPFHPNHNGEEPLANNSMHEENSKVLIHETKPLMQVINTGPPPNLTITPSINTAAFLDQRAGLNSYPYPLNLQQYLNHSRQIGMIQNQPTHPNFAPYLNNIHLANGSNCPNLPINPNLIPMQMPIQLPLQSQIPFSNLAALPNIPQFTQMNQMGNFPNFVQPGTIPMNQQNSLSFQQKIQNEINAISSSSEVMNSVMSSSEKEALSSEELTFIQQVVKAFDETTCKPIASLCLVN